MTPARRQRKAWSTRTGRRGIPTRLALAAALALATPGASPLRAATTERIVADVHTGLAISGLDAVTYFTDGAPVVGRGEHELSYRGVVWRFRNEGNRAAFVAHPDVYMPRYGGYDPIALGRGVAVPGNPLLWARVGDRIYLFYDERARDRFVADPNEAILLADNKWPGVVRDLVP